MNLPEKFDVSLLYFDYVHTIIRMTENKSLHFILGWLLDSKTYVTSRSFFHTKVYSYNYTFVLFCLVKNKLTFTLPNNLTSFPFVSLAKTARCFV